MTEDDARKRWCPFARTYHQEENEDVIAVVTVNRGRDGAPDAWCLCLASHCMAWRWDLTGSSPAHHEGYCGLAGPNPS